MPSLWRPYRTLHGPGLYGRAAAYSPTDVVLERLAHTDPDLVPDDL
jgi:hypothetical protein